VRRLGGTILLQSEIGAGTTFVVRLPRVLSQLNEGEG
jgi:signal transduction histidine kinase